MLFFSFFVLSLYVCMSCTITFLLFWYMKTGLRCFNYISWFLHSISTETWWESKILDNILRLLALFHWLGHTCIFLILCFLGGSFCIMFVYLLFLGACQHRLPLMLWQKIWTWNFLRYVMPSSIFYMGPPMLLYGHIIWLFTVQMPGSYWMEIFW